MFEAVVLVVATLFIAAPARSDCLVYYQGTTTTWFRCITQGQPCWTAPACSPVTVKTIRYDEEVLKRFIDTDTDCIMVISTAPPCTTTTEQRFARKYEDHAWGLCGSAGPTDTCRGGRGNLRSPGAVRGLRRLPRRHGHGQPRRDPSALPLHLHRCAGGRSERRRRQRAVLVDRTALGPGVRWEVVVPCHISSQPVSPALLV